MNISDPQVLFLISYFLAIHFSFFLTLLIFSLWCTWMWGNWSFQFTGDREIGDAIWHYFKWKFFESHPHFGGFWSIRFFEKEIFILIFISFLSFVHSFYKVVNNFVRIIPHVPSSFREKNILPKFVISFCLLILMTNFLSVSSLVKLAKNNNSCSAPKMRSEMAETLFLAYRSFQGFFHSLYMTCLVTSQILVFSHLLFPSLFICQVVALRLKRLKITSCQVGMSSFTNSFFPIWSILSL